MYSFCAQMAPKWTLFGAPKRKGRSGKGGKPYPFMALQENEKQ